jgi:long-chain acyl-CoA synthetase
VKLAAFLAAHALATPEREAIACGSVRLSFRDIDERSTRLASALAARGVAIGDRVAIYLSNRAEFGVAFMGIVKAGAIAITLNPRLSAAEVAYILADAAPRAVILENETRDTLARACAAAIDPASAAVDRASGAVDRASGAVDRASAVLALRLCVDESCAPGEVAFSELIGEGGMLLRDIPPEFDDCMISYTSGTTGKPKGAIITQANYIMLAAYVNGLQWGLSSADRMLATTPLAHRSAFQRLMNMVCAGTSLVVMQRFDPKEAARIIEDERITLMGMVPTVGRMLLPEMEAAPQRFRTLRAAVVTGEAFPVEVKQRLLRVLPHLQLHSFFAMTEVGAITNLGPAEQFAKGASVGRVNPGVELKLVDDRGAQVASGEVGEILVRSGPAGSYLTMRGYFNNPQATAEAIEDGWVRTGDLGRVDAEGYLYIVDRKKDMVLSGGYNIYSKEVEAAILDLPEVQDVAVIGVPDALYGEAVAAFVETRPGAALAAERVIEHCRERIASYKKPRHVCFVSGLPRNSMGKVLKYQLREAFVPHED